MSRIGIVTNPTAGSGRAKRSGAQALTALSAGGHHLVDLTRSSWGASLAAAMEQRAGLDALVVVGGDGMSHLGAQVCGGTSLPLGIVAAGSGNDAAASLGLPVHDVAAAVRRIEQGLAGMVTRVDLGAMTGPSVDEPAQPRYFIAVLSAGIDAAIAAYAGTIRFPRGPLKYKLATMRELPRFEPYGVHVRVDGKQWSQRCTLVAVANGPVFGGGLIVSPESSMTDGQLELVLAEPLTRRGIIRLFPSLYDGSHLADPRVMTVKGAHIEIMPAALAPGDGGEVPADSRPGAALPAAFADGERVGDVPLTIRVAPGALRVLGVDPGK